MKVTLSWVALDPVADATHEVGEDRTITREEWRLGYREARMLCRHNIEKLCKSMASPGATLGSFSGVRIMKTSDLIH